MRGVGPDQAHVSLRRAAPDSVPGPVRALPQLSVSVLNVVVGTAFGLLMLAAAVANWARGGARGAPFPVLYGLVFLTLAGVHTCKAIAGWRLRWRMAHGPLSWDADHVWPHAGETRGAWGRIGGVFARPSGIEAVLGVLGLMVLAAALSTGLWVVAVPTAALLLLHTGIRALRAAFGSDRRVTYLQRPYAPDGPIVVRVGVGVAGSAIAAMTVTLRCIRERPRVPTAWSRARGRAERRALWRGRVVLGEAPPIPDAGGDVDVRFDPPPGLPSTQMSADFPTYWELEVATSGGDGEVSTWFLLPVYRTGAERSDAAPLTP